MMEKIPDTVFITLGVTRSRAISVGMVGCGLQLDDHFDYKWSETTFSLSLDNQKVRLFLKVNGIPFTYLPSHPSVIRIPFLQMEQYIGRYDRLCDFIIIYEKNRFLRLGADAYLDPSDLDSRHAFILCMPNEEFDKFFISDPRGRLFSSEVFRRCHLHSPVLRDGAPPGLPDPGEGGWI